MTTTMQNNIKKQLSAKNMSAAELERRTGIPHAVVNILHGRSKNPSIKTAQAIAKELGCSLEDLLSETHSAQQAAKPCWNAKVYKAAFEAVYNCIQSMGLQPEIEQVSASVNEIYTYTIGGKNTTVDLRFVEWYMKKNFT
jgi:DNA-binding Xre family transcriptional regulator